MSGAGGEAAQQPSAFLALMLAVVCVVAAAIMFPLAEAGPSSDFFGLAFPFVVGGLGLGAGRYALRTWRTVSALEAGSRRSRQQALVVLALLADLGLIGLALIWVFLMTVGIGIS